MCEKTPNFVVVVVVVVVVAAAAVAAAAAVVVAVVVVVVIIIIIIIIIPDRLCGLVVRVSGYRYRGPGFNPRRYQIF